MEPSPKPQDTGPARRPAQRPGSGRMRALGKLRLLLIVGLCCANVLVLALATDALYRSREQFLLLAESTTSNVSEGVVNNISALVGKADLTLHMVALEIERQLKDKRLDYTATNAFLAGLREHLPEFAAVRVVDAAGRLIMGERAGADARRHWDEREFFGYHREQPGDRLHFSKPFVGLHSQQFVVAITRRINKPDGGFGGAAIVTIPVAYFTALMARYDLGSRGSFILRDDDLGLISRVPPIPDRPAGQIGNRDVSPIGRQVSAAQQPVVSYRAAAGSDGLERVYTQRRVPNAPMIVGASVASDDYLTPWKREAFRTLALVLGFLLLSLVTGALMLRQYRRAKWQQDQLLQSEERLRAITDYSGAVISLKNPQGRYLYVNQVYERLFDVRNEAIEGKTDFDVFPAEFAKAFSENDQTVMRTGRLLEMEERAPRADGVHYYHTVKFPLRDADDRIYAVCGIATDITERRQARAEREALQAKLEENLETYRSILATSLDGFMHIARDGRIADVNATYCRLSGYTRAELIGRQLSDVEALESDAAVDAHNRRIRERGSDQFESRHRRKDGSLWDVEVSASYSPISGGQYFGFVRDITGRKRAESALRLSEEKFRKAFELSPDGININRVDDGMYVSINSGFTRTLGYTPEEIVGRTSIELNIWENPEDRERLVRMLKRDGVVNNLEARFRAKDGSIRTGLRSAALIDIDGVPHIIGVTRDITDRKHAEEARAKLEVQLRASQKMEALGTLAGGVAHDFNNIIAAILGNVELARQDADPGHAVQESLGEIRKASLRAKALVQQILSFSRRQVIERRVISLVPVVQESERLLRATLPAGVRLSVRCAPDTPRVLADAMQIEQVLINLSTNAWQAIQDLSRAGSIDIVLEKMDVRPGRQADAGYMTVSGEWRAGNYACLSVSDNGVGMPVDTLTRIFEPFFTTKPVGKGTGLGLAVVHGIVQEHDGCIEVRSIPGEGSCFRIYLPQAQAGPSEEASASASAAPTAFTHKHVLYLDDDESIVYLVKRLLERQNYRVEAHTRAREAIEAVRSRPDDFALVITDYNMPDLSGLDVAQAIRTLRPDLPIAMASGYITDELRHKAEQAGIADLIYKPNTVEELCLTVAQLLKAASAGGSAS